MNNETYSYFDDYVEDTLDPGWSLVIGSLIACLVLHATLPCMVTLGSRYERQKRHADGNSTSDDDDTSSDEDAAKRVRTSGPTRQHSVLLEKMTSTATPD